MTAEDNVITGTDITAAGRLDTQNCHGINVVKPSPYHSDLVIIILTVLCNVRPMDCLSVSNSGIMDGAMHDLNSLHDLVW